MAAGNKAPPPLGYWEKRAVALSESLLAKGDAYYERLTKEYMRAIANVEKEIEAFYGRFAKENKITYVQAKKLLNSAEAERFRMDVQEYIKRGQTLGYSREWAHELENASTVHRITRLQYLGVQMRQQVEVFYAKYNTGLEGLAADVFTEGYYRNLYEMQKAAGAAMPFATLDTAKVKNIVAKPWAPDGTNFSAKIWRDRDIMVNDLNTRLTQAFIRGENPDRLARYIADRYHVETDADGNKVDRKTRLKNARRLIQTETAFFSAKSKQESYEAQGYKKYKIVAVMDFRTSAICREMDGEVFDLEDFRPGATANPFHPSCRTTTVPYVERGGGAKSPGHAINPRTGKLEAMPADMSYKEWFRQFSQPGRPEFVEHIATDMLDKKLRKWEDSIKGKAFETAYIVTRAGDAYRVTGDKDSVSLAGIDLAGAVITHNHPPDEDGLADAFGEDDIMYLRAHPEISSLRAVTPFYRYVLRLLKPLSLKKTDIYANGLQMAYDAGKPAEVQHYMMEYLREAGYIDYTRTEIK